MSVKTENPTVSRPEDGLFDLDGLDLADEAVESAVEATEVLMNTSKDDIDEEGLHLYVFYSDCLLFRS